MSAVLTEMAQHENTPKGGFLVALRQLMLNLKPMQAVRVRDVSWQEYRDMCELRDQVRPGTKMYYEQGSLEIVAPSFFHDRISERLADCVKVFAEEFNIPIISAGSTTFRREAMEDGLEPDKCFYIKNIEKVRYLDDIDLAIHPPPDLAIEVDRSHSSEEKLSLYAKLGVPEVWRFDAEGLTIASRQLDGRYFSSAMSVVFPMIKAADLWQIVSSHTALDDMSFIRNVRNWVRQLQLAQTNQPS